MIAPSGTARAEGRWSGRRRRAAMRRIFRYHRARTTTIVFAAKALPFSSRSSRGCAILFQTPTLNRGNLRRQCEAKGTSRQVDADSSYAPPRDGAVHSSDEAAERWWGEGAASFSRHGDQPGNREECC